MDFASRPRRCRGIPQGQAAPRRGGYPKGSTRGSSCRCRVRHGRGGGAERSRRGGIASRCGPQNARPSWPRGGRRSCAGCSSLPGELRQCRSRVESFIQSKGKLRVRRYPDIMTCSSSRPRARRRQARGPAPQIQPAQHRRVMFGRSWTTDAPRRRPAPGRARADSMHLVPFPASRRCGSRPVVPWQAAIHDRRSDRGRVDVEALSADARGICETRRAYHVHAKTTSE